MEAVFTCYNEEKSGDIEEAVKISNEEYLIWKHPNKITKRLKYPTKILIKLVGKKEYFIGDLLLVRDFSDFNPKIFVEDKLHRPHAWRKKEGGAESVMIIANLTRTEEPFQVKDKKGPRGQEYIEL